MPPQVVALVNKKEEMRETLPYFMITLILLDASGDAFRSRGCQVVHHIFEATHEAIWLGLLAYFTKSYNIIPIYILCRIAIFDVLYNLIAGNKLNYVGKSSVYGIVMTWFAMKIREQGFLIWVVRAMALIAWVILMFVK